MSFWYYLEGAFWITLFVVYVGSFIVAIVMNYLTPDPTPEELEEAEKRFEQERKKYPLAPRIYHVGPMAFRRW